MPSHAVISYIVAKVEVTKALGRFALAQCEQFPALSQRVLRKIWSDNRRPHTAHVFELQFSRHGSEVWMGLTIPRVGRLWALKLDRDAASTIALAIAKLFAEIEEEAHETYGRAMQALAILKTLNRVELEAAIPGNLASDDGH